MHTIEGVSVKANGSDPRPFVPLDLEYAVAGSDELRAVTKVALVDSGATGAALPVRMLPADVRWDDLTPTSVRVNGVMDRGFEIRIWHARLSVFGVRIASSVLVFGEGSNLNNALYPVLGLESVFAHFNIGFAWGSIPPIFTMVPHGQAEPQPATRWRLDRETWRWEAIVTVDTPAPPAGLRVVGPWVDWTGKPGLPTVAELQDPTLNRAQRRRLGTGRSRRSSR